MARAKSKTTRPAKADIAARPPADEAREPIVSMKGSREYQAWFEGIHKKTYIPKAQIVRLALAEWAASHGHPVPPEM